jgi:hypothetical protein
MPTVTTLRTSVLESTPVLAAIGATDLAVERLRAAVGNAATVPSTAQARLRALDPGKIVAAAQQMPSIAVGKALAAAGRAEAGYADAAKRGTSVVRRRTTRTDVTATGTSTRATRAATPKKARPATKKVAG